MCQTCGCGATAGTKVETITVLENLLAENDRLAGHVRRHFDDHGVFAINVMSSPGAGKTSLLEATIQALSKDLRIGVIEGDLETENDADRIRRHGVPAAQITTGVACHLDARMVHDALETMPLAELDLLFIENVGNLVCPADFDIGTHANVVLLSVTEGDDKPEKYPVIFRAADLVLLTKTDLLPYLEEFDPARAEASMVKVRGQGAPLRLSGKTGAGLDAWTGWLKAQVAENRGLHPKDGKPHEHEHEHEHEHGHGHAHTHAPGA
ncbi:hydrogenase nickel incorporation protein HypB [Breoghania corrubedonensis]|uniref:Hydrogenase maturation factor HypB n=1 Tax=Breoghania corrubedonensis TaxID=665038 RepID=A0A2T5VGF7_9HYPH|nr:hydrogenase nickel incorporation protein HypB [Breoghania corrubedonensis]PTW62844.1 hydrogenase nickel incorporation protein HypB [Breoghania corrubedonensis]